MKITIIRHFPTEGNLLKRYIGSTDEAIAKVIEGLDYSSMDNGVVFVSPLKRAIETANYLFPKAQKIAVDNLREMNFGIFENKNYEELKDNLEYSKWLQSNCEEPCPNGESKKEFIKRTVSAIEEIKTTYKEMGLDEAVIVAHGGTAMAIGEALAKPRINYFDVRLDFGKSITFDI